MGQGVPASLSYGQVQRFKLSFMFKTDEAGVGKFPRVVITDSKKSTTTNSGTGALGGWFITDNNTRRAILENYGVGREGTTQWQKYEVIFTVNSTHVACTGTFVGFKGYSDGTAVYYDDVKLEKTDVVVYDDDTDVAAARCSVIDSASRIESEKTYKISWCRVAEAPDSERLMLISVLYEEKNGSKKLVKASTATATVATADIYKILETSISTDTLNEGSVYILSIFTWDGNLRPYREEYNMMN